MNTTTLNTTSPTMTTLGTAAGSGGAAYALVTLISWALSLGHMVVPDNVSNAMLVLITIGIHYIVADKKTTTVTTPSDTVVIPTPLPPAPAPVAATKATPLESIQASLFAHQPAQIG